MSELAYTISAVIKPDELPIFEKCIVDDGFSVRRIDWHTKDRLLLLIKGTVGKSAAMRLSILRARHEAAQERKHVVQ